MRSALNTSEYLPVLPYDYIFIDRITNKPIHTWAWNRQDVRRKQQLFICVAKVPKLMLQLIYE